jgi:hypothetical protein
MQGGQCYERTISSQLRLSLSQERVLRPKNSGSHDALRRGRRECCPPAHTPLSPGRKLYPPLTWIKTSHMRSCLRRGASISWCHLAIAASLSGAKASRFDSAAAARSLLTRADSAMRARAVSGRRTVKSSEVGSIPVAGARGEAAAATVSYQDPALRRSGAAPSAAGTFRGCAASALSAATAAWIMRWTVPAESSPVLRGSDEKEIGALAVAGRRGSGRSYTPGPRLWGGGVIERGVETLGTHTTSARTDNSSPHAFSPHLASRAASSSRWIAAKETVGSRPGPCTHAECAFTCSVRTVTRGSEQVQRSAHRHSDSQVSPNLELGGVITLGDKVGRGRQLDRGVICSSHRRWPYRVPSYRSTSRRGSGSTSPLPSHHGRR